MNAAGGYITPGFLDIHRHGDWQAFGNGDDELLNRQGLTTVVNGNCGLSVAPAGEKFGKEIARFLSSVTGDFRWGKDENTDDTEGVLFSKKKEESCGISEKEIEIAALRIMSTMSAYLSALGKEKRSVNTGMLAGNGTIRASVKGYASGKLSKEELHQVWKAVEEALSAGALGISLGIAYAPEFEYDRDGLAEALQPLKGTDIPITTHIRNEGDGILLALQEVISEDGIIVEKYRDRKLLERYLESVALKYDMTLAELSLLLYRKDAGKALTRGAEAQMPAREDAVEATDRKDAGKALSRKDLAELMHMSLGDLRAALQKLVSRGMLEVVDVPRKRREAAEIAEATGLFGKRGEAQDADANGMTKKKREPRKIRLELLPASDAVLQDIAAAERDYEQAKFRGFTEDELRQYTALERRVQENEKQILQK